MGFIQGDLGLGSRASEKLGVPLGVPIERGIKSSGLYWGPLVSGNC